MRKSVEDSKHKLLVITQGQLSVNKWSYSQQSGQLYAVPRARAAERLINPWNWIMKVTRDNYNYFTQTICYYNCTSVTNFRYID